MTRSARCLCLLAALGLWGCPEPAEPEPEVRLLQKTGAPPTLDASIDHTSAARSMKLSAGVAMAVTCWDSCADAVKLCESATITVDAPEVIEPREIYAATTSSQPAFVLAAKQPGAAYVTISTRCGTQTYRAMVE